jgi:acyl transferase domain-containing protein/acyl carrier protein
MSDFVSADGLGSIAVIGMSGRFPGARNLHEYWRNLREGVECISFFSAEELSANGLDPAVLGESNYVSAKGVLPDSALFDASFFGFSPRDAEVMDPQHRVFLECAWEALEDAGYHPEDGSSIGVYAGTSLSGYLLNLLANPDIMKAMGSYQVTIGNDKDHLTTRVAYKLNLRGPCITVQTTCSSSLVAVCLACQALLNYQCDMALAGGVSITLPLEAGYFYQEGGIASPDGHCRAFDARAQGTLTGNGVGVVVLKRLADALADGDHIHAVIRGTAVNNDGSLKVGYTAPSVEGQAEVIALAHSVAGISPETISYVEAHGTGTPLGDPIEIAALTQAFRAGTAQSGFCAIGSVKTNIGHLDAAAGVASLIKTILALEHREIPASLHFERPNPRIDFAESPFYVNTSLAKWEAAAAPRRAGVSSFGIGGTNAHVVLEEAEVAVGVESSRPLQLLVWSAQTASALEAATAGLARHLRQHPDVNLADVAYTLQVGRRASSHRRMLVCRDAHDAASALEGLAPGRVLTRDHESEATPVAFLFPGQGTQYPTMALGLYQVEPAFREQVDACSELLRPVLGLDLRGVLYPSEARGGPASQHLDQTHLTQPALFVVEYALARLLMHWGVRPQAMLGHSLGEYVAASLAGVFSLEDSLALVGLRGRLMQGLPSGGMLSVSLSEEALRSFVNGNLSLAAINSTSSCVVSGPLGAVDALERQLAAQGVSSLRLHTSHAFHSAATDAILDAFVQQVRKYTLHAPQIPFVSNVTGDWITAEQATDPHYWATHLRQTVRFASGLRTVLQDSRCVLLEVGPGQSLTSLAKGNVEVAPERLVPSMRHAQDRQSDIAVLNGALGRLWLAGTPIDWPAYWGGERRHRVSLPTYPFERQRYWVEPQAPDEDGPTRRRPSHKREDLTTWFYSPIWKQSIAPVRTSAPRDDDAAWLVFKDGCGLCSRLVAHLGEQGVDVFTVAAGDRYRKDGNRAFTVDPRDRRHYDLLLQELRSLGRVPGTIVHLWSLTPSEVTTPPFESLERFQGLGFTSLVFIAQALGDHGGNGAVQIAVVCNDVQEVTGDEVLCPEKALLLGPCLVIPQEYPNVTCRSIDVVLPGSDGPQLDRVVRQVAGELAAEASDPAVAYRGNHRWVRAFEPCPLEGDAASASPLRERGVYLITGGLGGIGLTLADHLARAVHARLILIGRSAFPDRDTWPRWSARHGDRDDVGRKIRKLQALEELGAEVLVVSADVTDQKHMETALARARERFGPIHGVIHAAGVAGGGVIQLKTERMANEILAPKVWGAIVLQTLLKETPLDFLVVCSSLSSVVGGVGQVDYCAANAFLDAFARRGAGGFARNGVAINWSTWQDVGMALNTVAPKDIAERREEALRQGMLSSEGAEAFARILRSGLPQVAVSPQDLTGLTSQREPETSRAAGNDRRLDRRAPAGAAHSRPALATPYVAPRNAVEQVIAERWREVLGIEQVGVNDNFFALGGHSLLATQLLGRLREALQADLPLARLFETPTVAGLAESIEHHESSNTRAPFQEVPDER